MLRTSTAPFPPRKRASGPRSRVARLKAEDSAAGAVKLRDALPDTVSASPPKRSLRCTPRVT